MPLVVSRALASLLLVDRAAFGWLGRRSCWTGLEMTHALGDPFVHPPVRVDVVHVDLPIVPLKDVHFLYLKKNCKHNA